jgi:hypothetical protein
MMRSIRFILLPAILLLAGYSRGQCPQVMFYGDDHYTEGCNPDGHVNLSLAICDNQVTQPYVLDHVVWTMGAGLTPVTTNTLQISYTYPLSGTYNVSAVAYFTVNGVACSTAVLHKVFNGLFEERCDYAVSTTFYQLSVQLFDAELYTIPVTIPANGTAFGLSYQGVSVVNTDFSYDLFVDGAQVVTNATLPASSPVQLNPPAPAVYAPGQHIAEIVVKNKLLTNCPVSSTVVFEVPPVPEPPVCADCFTFRPIPGKRYWISAWVREAQATQVLNYLNTSVKVTFNTGGTTATFAPAGDIIDGWQRIAGDFTVPAGTTSIAIELKNAGSVAAYFDDIRIHPFNASMKSYVNDPETFWLTAELDDNNYATFYEYDREGKLIRIKKETAEGIMTIQESRSSNFKQ